MAEIYNNAFRIGLSASLFIWMVVNIISYYFAQKQFEEYGFTISHGSGPLFDWGVPFSWSGVGGFLANAVTFALSGILVGHLARFLQEKYFSAEKE